MHLGKENCQPIVIPKLEILEVEHCVNLQSLMSSAISFQNLTTLKVTGCHGLQYLITCSIAQSLLQLTHLEVKDCQNLIEIVGGNQDDAGNEIAFTRLQHLELSALQSLRRFCSENCLVKLPSLDTLLVVTDCLVKLSISPDRVLLTEFNPERFLQNFNNLRNLVLHGDHKEIFFHDDNSSGETLPNLKSLKLSEMHMLMHLGKENSQTIIPNLEILEVSLCGKLKNLTSPAISFQNLTTLKVFGCHGLEYLITSSISQSLIQLIHLEVKDCERLKEIVGSSSEHEAGNEIAFNRLGYLELSGLPSLQCFFSGNCISQTSICNEIEERKCIGTVVTCYLFNEKIVMPNLTILKVHQCDGLRFLLSTSMARSLVQLKDLEVCNCQIMEEIVSAKESGEEMNTYNIFLKLNHLKLKHLPQLTRFCIGNHIEFPSLETLHMEDCARLETFIFDPAVIKNEETDPKDNLETPGQYFLFDEKVGFPSLKLLIIDDLPKLMTIWHEQLAPDSFCRLAIVHVQKCHSLINIFGACIMGRLNTLDILRVTQCRSLQLVFEDGGINAKETDDTSMTPSKLPEYCHNLVVVDIQSCDSLRNIFPASVAKSLPHLRLLHVRECDSVEEIVAMEGVGVTTPTFVFPNATSVKFAYLPQLASFYPGMHASFWPLLEDLLVMSCDNVEIFSLEFSKLQVKPELGLVGTPTKQPLFLIQKGSFSNLKLLHLYYKVGRMKDWWRLLPAELFSKLKSLTSDYGVFQSGFLLNLPHLEELNLQNFENEYLFVHDGISSGQNKAVVTLLPRLKRLTLFAMPEVMHLGKENCPLVFPNLEKLEVMYSRKLKNLMSSAISYQNLQSLKVTKCDELEYLITCSMAQSLTQLTRLKVKNCQGLIEIVANSKRDGDAVSEIAIKSLQSLELSGLPSLQGFCSGNCIVKLPSLGTLTVTDCLIELKISPDKILLSNSKSEKLKLIEEEPRDHDKPEGSGTK